MKRSAIYEADTGANGAQIIVQYLFDRPGFQQDPVADTSDDTLIGAHCSCPTRLNGFSRPPEPFELIHHHGNRDAVPRTIWKRGQEVLSFPGMHQLFFYGDYRKQLKEFCQLFNFEAKIA